MPANIVDILTHSVIVHPDNLPKTKNSEALVDLVRQKKLRAYRDGRDGKLWYIRAEEEAHFF